MINHKGLIELSCAKEWNYNAHKTFKIYCFNVPTYIYIRPWWLGSPTTGADRWKRTISIYCEIFNKL